MLILKGHRPLHTHYSWESGQLRTTCMGSYAPIVDRSLRIDEVDCMHCLRRGMAGAFTMVDRMKAIGVYLRLKQTQVIRSGKPVTFTRKIML